MVHEKMYKVTKNMRKNIKKLNEIIKDKKTKESV